MRHHIHIRRWHHGDRDSDLEEPFSFARRHWKKVLLEAGMMFVLSYFIIMGSIAKQAQSIFDIILPIIILTVLFTAMYTFSWYFLFVVYRKRASEIVYPIGSGTKGTAVFIFKVATTIVLIPEFIRIMSSFFAYGNAVFAVIIMLLVPYWILFSIMIRRMLNSLYAMGLLLLLFLLVGMVFWGILPGDFLKGISFLEGYMDFVSAVFLPALVSDIIMQLHVSRKVPAAASAQPAAPVVQN